ncbi:MAG: hypothetical protein Q8Q31_05890 [Nanoarchaeota archaeon]|nr:hypothetical protein [Nanoarchaeota archaeon]
MPKKRVDKKKVESHNKGQGTKGMIAVLWGFVAWLTGIIVSLAVGSGLITHTLYIPWIPEIVTETAGWIVVILTILGAMLAVLDRVR